MVNIVESIKKSLSELDLILDNLYEGYEEYFENDKGYLMVVTWNEHSAKPFECSITMPSGTKFKKQFRDSGELYYQYIKPNGYKRTTK